MSDPSQQDRQAYGLDMSEERKEPAASPHALRGYVAAMVIAPFLLLIGSLVWMATPEYQRHAQFPSFVGLGYGARLRHSDCQVLVDGDSSALTGVMPAVIEQRTGLKTCNIAEVAGVKYINGMAELDAYLAHNRRPRFLLLLFVPENLTPPGQWWEVAHTEGWFYGIRYNRGRNLLRQMIHDPNGVMIGAEELLRTGVQWLPDRTLPPDLAQLRERNQGWLPEPGTPLTGCPAPLRIAPPDRDYLQSLRHRYGVGGTTVLIDVTPEPPCDPTLAFYAARTGPGVTDNTLETLPLGDFTNTGRLHTDRPGAEVISGRIAAQIAGQIGVQIAVPTPAREQGSTPGGSH